MKKEKIKDFLKNNKKGVLIGVAVIIILLVVGIIILLNVDKKPDDEKKPGNDKVISDEETIEEEYGFSKEDAIEVIKKIYLSDNYEFSAEAREDNMWIVTVKNIETGSETKYVVDPNNGTHQEIFESESDE